MPCMSIGLALGEMHKIPLHRVHAHLRLVSRPLFQEDVNTSLNFCEGLSILHCGGEVI